MEVIYRAVLYRAVEEGETLAGKCNVWSAVVFKILSTSGTSILGFNSTNGVLRDSFG